MKQQQQPKAFSVPFILCSVKLAQAKEKVKFSKLATVNLVSIRNTDSFRKTQVKEFHFYM